MTLTESAYRVVYLASRLTPTLPLLPDPRTVELALGLLRGAGEEFREMGMPEESVLEECSIYLCILQRHTLRQAFAGEKLRPEVGEA